MKLIVYYVWGGFVELDPNDVKVVQRKDVLDGAVEAIDVLAGQFRVKDMNLLKNREDYQIVRKNQSCGDEID
jgi:hypothetical protein